MSCSTYFAGDTIVHRLDARSRTVVMFAFALLVASCRQFAVLWVALALALGLAALARLPMAPLSKRLIRVNVFMLMVFLLLPTTTPGEPVFTLGPLVFSREGLALASRITLKANAIVLMFTALLGTVEIAALGQAFQHLHVPDKLIHLLMFTLRYLDVLHHEYVGLLRAMKARAFRPGMNRLTYRSYAYLLAMLMVRSLERAERVMDAMKCRGFKGTFHACRRLTFHRRDAVFCSVSVAVLAVLMFLEWGWKGVA